MYTAYTNETSKEDLLYEPSERTSDIQLPPIINTLLLVTWTVISLFGLAIIYFTKSPLLGALIIAIPTFIGMVIKPTFALCMMMLVLPTGAGVGYATTFSLDRGVGIALAVSFLLNLMISQPSLHVRNKALWVLVIYTIWIFFSSLAAPYIGLELQRAFTQFQSLTLVFIVYWILQTNGEKTFHWALRAYIVGTLGTIIIAYKSGAAMIAMEEESGRYSATAGEAIGANLMAVLLSMAFFATLYLLIRDKHIFWRIIYLIALVSLPIMVIRTGSRGGLISLVFTISSPLLFIRQVLRRPALAALLLVIILIASASTSLLIKKKGLETTVATRLTDISYAEQSLGYRINLIKKAIEAAGKYPTGTGSVGWFERTGENHIPHNDFFYALGIYGIPAAMLFTVFAVIMMLTVKRMPLGIEKLYARAVLTFLLVMGLDMVQLYQKDLWIFLAIIMGIEHISRLKSNVTKYIDEQIDEEAADINY
ncbi:MAG: O-antigen ligase family protein [Phycisphaerae bacterium]|nr:O-antigen ligase family protein [Phycisphaerae bacterium]MDD5380274.1 O-antigen ligase family protein [Phycisphaerae bacterium]